MCVFDLQRLICEYNFYCSSLLTYFPLGINNLVCSNLINKILGGTRKICNCVVLCYFEAL